MERAVIETFDYLRPEVSPHFVQSKCIYDRDLPVIRELQRRQLPFSLLPDKKGWPRFGIPRSLQEAFGMLTAFFKGNLYLFRAAKSSQTLYAPSLYGASFNLLAALHLRINGRRVIHHFHDLSRSDVLLLRIWSWLVTDFVHNTEFGYEAMIHLHPYLSRKRNVVIPCIVDTEMLCSLDGSDLVPPSGRNLFYVGQVSRHKGVDLLLEAFVQVASQHKDVVLHIVGSCAQDFKDEFDRLCAMPNLAGRVKHWGFRSDALQLLGSAYLYIQPSPPSRFHESFGRSVVEAMSLRVPVICFKSGALQEIVVDGETGLHCDESSAGLASAIHLMLGNEELRNRYGQRGFERYERLYSKHNLRSRWLEFLLPVPVSDQSAWK